MAVHSLWDKVLTFTHKVLQDLSCLTFSISSLTPPYLTPYTQLVPQDSAQAPSSLSCPPWAHCLGEEPLQNAPMKDSCTAWIKIMGWLAWLPDHTVISSRARRCIIPLCIPRSLHITTVYWGFVCWINEGRNGKPSYQLCLFSSRLSL